MPITAIYDNLEINIKDLREYCRSHEDDNPTLTRLFNTAKRKADKFCQNEFVAENGEVEIPEDVEQWVYEIVARKYQMRASGLKSENVSGQGGITWEKEDYAELWPRRRNPGL